jgi:peroxiredoxin
LQQDYLPLPANLPVPDNDGAAAHLKGMTFPSISLLATDGSETDISRLPGLTVLYAYPKTGVPGHEMPDGWDMIPGARGCTPEACAFRDHFTELKAAGASAVFGLSTQSTDYQQEVRDRLHLPFEMLSDAQFQLTKALRLPTFEAGSETLLKRVTLIIRDGVIIHVFYPIFPPDGHAAEVLEWLRSCATMQS